MPQVVNRGGGERALGTLEVQPVLAQNIQDSTQVEQVLSPRGVVDQNVVEEHQDTPADERL